jgi:hypothetical protein
MPGKHPLILSSRPVPGAAIGRDVEFQRRLLPGPPEITHYRARRIDFRARLLLRATWNHLLPRPKNRLPGATPARATWNHPLPRPKNRLPSATLARATWNHPLPRLKNRLPGAMPARATWNHPLTHPKNRLLGVIPIRATYNCR